MKTRNENASEIGGRAYEVIKERSEKNGTKLGYEYRKIYVSGEAVYGWLNKGCNPSAGVLQQMALAGYDVYYVLTGIKNGGADNGH